MKILVINGPNLNMLGLREPTIYGHKSLEEINETIEGYFKEQEDLKIKFFQSNHEGHIVDKIQEARGKYDGIVINPAAYTHYSIAIRDAVSSAEVPTVEVHLSNIESREPFRKISVIKDVCIQQIAGKGIDSYIEGIQKLIEYLEGKQNGYQE